MFGIFMSWNLVSEISFSHAFFVDENCWYREGLLSVILRIEITNLNLRWEIFSTNPNLILQFVKIYTWTKSFPKFTIGGIYVWKYK